MFSSYGVDLNCVQNFLWGDVFGRFARLCEKSRSHNNPKIGVRFMFLTISLKLLYQIGWALSLFAGPKLSLPAVFSGFSSRPNQKVINF